MPTSAYIALALLAFALAAWDIARRVIQQRNAVDGAARRELDALVEHNHGTINTLVERINANTERNDNAIKNLLAQVIEITKWQERSKQEAAARGMQRRP